ncbi:MAG: MFS transporter [Deltaproteobacteria bacterium]|nr:MFS transporter [Deltaproteobacteria bacterium]
MDLSKISEPQGRDSETSFFHRLFPVKRHEALTVVLLALNVFVLLTCYYLLKVLREPLILLGGGAELKAYASAGQTILLLGIVPAFGWLASRVSRLRLLTTMQLIFMGCLVGFYVLAQARAPIGLAFYLWVGIFSVLVISNFWSFTNDLFTEEEGKRLFAVIGIGATLGAIVGAFVPRFLHSSLGVTGMMLVAMAGLGLSILLYRVVDIRERARRERVKSQKAAKAEEPMSKRGGFALLLADRYLRLIAAMVLISTIINTTGEYVVGKIVVDAAKATADPGAYINAFYSSYYTVVNIVTALLQALLVTRIIMKLGVRGALFIMPLVVLGGWFGMILFINLSYVRIAKTAENSVDYSLNNTVKQALFLPTRREVKFKAKAAIDTFVFRLGDVIAGLGIVALFVEVLGLGIRAFAVMNVGLAAIWLVLAHYTGKLHDELVAKQEANADANGKTTEGEAGTASH